MGEERRFESLDGGTSGAGGIARCERRRKGRRDIHSGRTGNAETEWCVVDSILRWCGFSWNLLERNMPWRTNASAPHKHGAFPPCVAIYRNHLSLCSAGTKVESVEEISDDECEEMFANERKMRTGSDLCAKGGTVRSLLTPCVNANFKARKIYAY